MSSKQCEKCGESVDAAKAFCPGCGHAFVEEERRFEASEFNRQAGTVQFDQEMYNNLFSEMGISPPDIPGFERKQAETNPQPDTPEKISEKSSSNDKWAWVLAGVAIVLFLFVFAAAAILVLTGFRPK